MPASAAAVNSLVNPSLDVLAPAKEEVSTFTGQPSRDSMEGGGMGLSELMEAKEMADEVSAPNKIPWYIIDPTGVYARRQRLASISKSAIERSQRDSGDLSFTASRKTSMPRRMSRLMAAAQTRSTYNVIYSRMTIFPAWDAIGAAALLFTAAVTPFEVGFLPAPTTALEPLFIINRLVDLVFVLDVFFQFFIMVPIEAKVGQAIGKQEWEMSPRRLAERYCKGWFGLDVISILPSTFDILPLVSDDGPDAGGAKALRTLRALRLVKLLRLMRASRVFQRFRERISLSSVTTTLITLLAQTLLLTHAYSCAVAISTTFASSPLDTWLATFGYCKPAAFDASGAPVVDAVGEPLVECVNVEYRYLMCLFWSVQLLTGYAIHPSYGPFEPYYSSIRAASVAGGGTTVARLNGEWEVQYTAGEYVLLLFLLLFGVFAWTVIFGNLIVALTQADPDKKRFTEGLDSLNRFCSSNNLDENLTHELRRYYFHTIDVHKYDSRMSAIMQLSPSLMEKVTWQLNQEWLLAIPCFTFGKVHPRERRSFLCSMVLRMKPAIFAPKEMPPGKRLYFISQGSVHYRTGGGRSKLIGPGQCWGWPDLLLLRSKPLKAVTNTYVHTSFIGKEDFVRLRNEYPNAYFSVKTWTVLKEVTAYMIRECGNVKAVEAKEAKKGVDESATGVAPPALSWSEQEIDSLTATQCLALKKSVDLSLEKKIKEGEAAIEQLTARSALAALSA